MTRTLFLVVGSIVCLSAAGTAAADTWADVPLVDAMCATKVKDQPDQHTKACALQCAKSGFGIIAADGTFLALDEAGNTQVIAALKVSGKTDHLRVTVTGERQGDTIAVSRVRLQ